MVEAGGRKQGATVSERTGSQELHEVSSHCEVQDRGQGENHWRRMVIFLGKGFPVGIASQGLYQSDAALDLDSANFSSVSPAKAAEGMTYYVHVTFSHN